MTFRLADHGTVFSTRPRGAALRSEVLAEAESSENICLSFAGVRSVSYSFADEFVGAIASTGKTVTFTDVSPPVRTVILGTLRRRGIKTPERDLFDLAPA